jgi:hypothetical protein
VTFRAYIIWFLFIACISGLLAALASGYKTIWLVALVTILYFVWHGYENEHTLFNQSTGNTLSIELLMGISLVTVGLTIDVFRHSSAQFVTSLIYTSALIPGMSQLLTVVSSTLLYTGVSCLVAGIVLIVVSCKKYHQQLDLAGL